MGPVGGIKTHTQGNLPHNRGLSVDYTSLLLDFRALGLRKLRVIVRVMRVEVGWIGGTVLVLYYDAEGSMERGLFESVGNCWEAGLSLR